MTINEFKQSLLQEKSNYGFWFKGIKSNLFVKNKDGKLIHLDEIPDEFLDYHIKHLEVAPNVGTLIVDEFDN